MPPAQLTDDLGGVSLPSFECGRTVLKSCHQAGSTARACAMEVNSVSLRHSSRNRPSSCSIFIIFQFYNDVSGCNLLGLVLKLSKQMQIDPKTCLYKLRHVYLPSLNKGAF
jgi:hypothetical protein